MDIIAPQYQISTSTQTADKQSFFDKTENQKNQLSKLNAAPSAESANKVDSENKIADNPVLDRGLDLTNIMPEDAYKLAADMYEEGQISIRQMASIMIVGFEHEYPASEIVNGNPTRNEEPFNLLSALAIKYDSAQGEYADSLAGLLDVLVGFFDHANDVKESQEKGTIIDVRV